jgi:hypothetical protein
MVPVSGKVTYKGQPVKDATVTFQNESSPRAATGFTDANGEFVLSTIDSNDGAMPGEHKIAIAARQPSTGATGAPNPSAGPEQMQAYMEAMKNVGKVKIENALPAKYADAKTSGLVRQVVEGEANNFNIDLTD